MSYTPIGWQTGDTITADKLNKMDNGWGMGVSPKTLLFEETVTTEGAGPAFAGLSYSTPINAPVITVTLNGVEYVCAYDRSIPGYGDVNFIEYPFVIDYYGENELVTPSAGVYTLKVETGGAPSLEVSHGFANAVAFHMILGETTYQEVENAFALGRLVIRYDIIPDASSMMEIVCGIEKQTNSCKIYTLSFNGIDVITNTYVAGSADSPIIAQ